MAQLIRRRSKLEVVVRDAQGTFSSVNEKECKRCRTVQEIGFFPIKAAKGKQRWYSPFCTPCLEVLTKRVCACGCGEVLPRTSSHQYLLGHDPTVVRVRPVGRREAVRNWRTSNPEKCLGYKLKHAFGISLETYYGLVAKQGNRCGICRTDKPGGRYRYWCVDHDHQTAAVRGLLCGRCNSGIAALGDSIEGIKRALAYFESVPLTDISPTEVSL
jgi:hypothetical protein